MKKSSQASGRVTRVASTALVRPLDGAIPYGLSPDRIYRRVIRDGWATFYLGRKRVWGCNDTFARYHFRVVPNDEMRDRHPSKSADNKKGPQNEN